MNSGGMMDRVEITMHTTYQFVWVAESLVRVRFARRHHVPTTALSGSATAMFGCKALA